MRAYVRSTANYSSVTSAANEVRINKDPDKRGSAGLHAENVARGAN